MKYPHATISEPVAALMPRNASGHQFLCYGDCCSGVPGARHEQTFASVNAVAARLWPPPEFICFLGDEVSGLTGDHNALRSQWHYWLEHEMSWLDREEIPIFHTASFHTTYDAHSERVFQEVLAHLPRNGPADQEGLTYFIRRRDLLLIFVNTSFSGLGGDGTVETEWLEHTLAAHADARHKLVLGHQPVHPVNGYAGPYMRELDPEHGARFWSVLVKHGVTAYICSHMLAFDVQVHGGVLQLMTAGAGTAHVLPGEYLHLTQVAIDQQGMRYQVIDTSGQIRERLSWPIASSPEVEWRSLAVGNNDAVQLHSSDAAEARITTFEFSGVAAAANDGAVQTMLSGWNEGSPERPLWIGLRGLEQQLAVMAAPLPGRSPQIWRGPSLRAGAPFSIQLAIHGGMGPGGFLCRDGNTSSWSSLASSSSWGSERLPPMSHWTIGHDRLEQPFRGSELAVRYQSKVERLW